MDCSHIKFQLYSYGCHTLVLHYGYTSVLKDYVRYNSYVKWIKMDPNKNGGIEWALLILNTYDYPIRERMFIEDMEEMMSCEFKRMHKEFKVVR